MIDRIIKKTNCVILYSLHSNKLKKGKIFKKVIKNWRKEGTNCVHMYSQFFSSFVFDLANT